MLGSIDRSSFLVSIFNPPVPLSVPRFRITRASLDADIGPGIGTVISACGSERERSS